jgi:ribosomal protein S18 acetylase RimI-like enzyme
MAFVGEASADTSTLIDAILASDEARRAATVLVCIRGGAPDLPNSLRDRGFRLETYRYLCASLVRAPRAPAFAAPPAVSGVRPWDADTDAVARLCERAYAGSAGIRAFAPGGTPGEWREYIETLVAGPGCGTFQAALSLVAPRPHSGREADGVVTFGAIDGAVVVTRVAPGIAHVAQLVVAPHRRGEGLGARLLRSVIDLAGCRGYSRMTLLVGETNEPAARLYARLGFEARAEFLVATRDQPRVSTSFALTTGGESTRR